MPSLNKTMTLPFLMIVAVFLSGCVASENVIRTKNHDILFPSIIAQEAKKGESYQQYNLGLMYLKGAGGKSKDPKLAAKWFQKSAENGHAEAQFILGDLYVDGVGIEKDRKKAFSWYEKSAKQSNYMGMYSLGAMYANGYGVKKDYKKARHWFQRAARNKGNWKLNSRAKKALAKLDKIEAKE